MKKNDPNAQKKTGRVLARKLARELNEDQLRAAAGGFYTLPGFDTSDPIRGEDVDNG